MARRTKKPVGPTGPELAYERALRAVARRLIREVEAFLRPALATAKAEEKAREDADPFAELDFGALRVRLGRIAGGSAAQIADEQGARVSRWNHQQMTDILGIDLARETPRVKRALASFRKENVGLIRSIADTLHAEVRDVVRTSTSRGTRVESLSRQIQERFGVTESRARLIARDQTLKANAALTQIRHQDAGVESYIWSTSRDERVRGKPGGKWAASHANHWALEGTIQSWSDPPITNPETGERHHPGEDYQCRCVAIPVLDERAAAPEEPEVESGE